MNIKFFDNSLEKFIKSLEPKAIAKILRTIDLLEMFGHKLGLPHSKKIFKNIFELRIYGDQKFVYSIPFMIQKLYYYMDLLKKHKKFPIKSLK